ncbi:photosystem II protein PsbQ [Leptolyngbya sp. FACHB-261]|uniref:photosystem II protein PsbQ n=1 Tax=Leptolyngbya sp. FACHB-261 TaxID=2692806 RepID=UPI00168890C0|nr:photosystem II protein PsbQ [Leptolyngbya sp. FACHB-261]MBD2104391.1 photosystem II protein PsbQ [Leptolyngbya sp. FACHB-261]
MIRLRSLLSAILVLVATFLIGCANPAPEANLTKVDTAKLEQIQLYTERIEAFRERFDELQSLITRQNWTDTDSLIHGPLGDLRHTVSGLARQLSPGKATQVRDLSKVLFKELVKIDQAATDENQAAAISAFARARQAFDSLLEASGS